MVAKKKREKSPARLKETGRPTKLNEEVCEALCENIKEGMPYKHACALVGISYPTFLSWEAKAELAIENKAPSKYTAAEGNYVNFLYRIRKAKANGIKNKLVAIREIGEGKDGEKPDWKALAWHLKCCDPESFGDKTQIDQKTEHSGGVSINLKMSDCSKKEDK